MTSDGRSVRPIRPALGPTHTVGRLVFHPQQSNAIVTRYPSLAAHPTLRLTFPPRPSNVLLMIPRWLLAVRGSVPRLYAVLLGLLPILALLGVWFALTAGPMEERPLSTILPSPVEVVQSVPQLLRSDSFGTVTYPLLENTWISLRRIGLGYLLAVAIVLPLAIGMGAFGIPRAMFTPITTAGGYIPIATLVPLTMAWFGTDEKQKIVFLAMAFGIYMLPMVLQAIDNVGDVFLRTSYTLGSSRRQTVFKVLIPIALPEIWHGMRLAFGVGWTYLVLAEAIDIGAHGLVAMVQMAQRRGPREHVYVVIILIAVIAWLADMGWVYLGQLLFPYRRTRT